MAEHEEAAVAAALSQVLGLPVALRGPKRGGKSQTQAGVVTVMLVSSFGQPGISFHFMSMLPACMSASASMQVLTCCECICS